MVNRFSRIVKKIKKFPKISHSFLLTKLFCSQVKYASTSKVTLVDIEQQQVKLSMVNRKRVQNHIGGVHAIAAALLAESATGIVFGLNLPDSCLPLLKSMTINYQRRMQGDLTAIASISDQQIALLTQEKGNMDIAVTITDESGEQPIECIMTWAWISKKPKSNKR
jgi:acyl-coenzyme A thioesterase PaaI-like protein